MATDPRYFETYKRQFIFDETMPTLQEFAKKHNIVSVGEFVRYATREDWDFHRQKYQEELGQLVRDRMLSHQSMDITQRIREIEAMQTKAWDAAVTLGFKTAGLAIDAYDKLEKLKRLLLGQSTANLTVADLDLYMVGVATILRQELEAEHPEAFDRIRARLSAYTLDDAKTNRTLPN